MASSFLKRKAEEQAKKIDKEYGEGKVLGTAYLKQSLEEAKKTKEKSSSTNSGGAGTKSKASSFLQKKAVVSALNDARNPTKNTIAEKIANSKVASEVVKSSTPTIEPYKTALSSNTSTYATDTQNAYSSLKDKVTSKTTTSSSMTEKERKARIREIDTELKNLNIQLSGYSRAKAYGTNRAMEASEQKVKDRIAELSEEKKTLERTGTFTASELKQFEIDDAKAKKSALPTYNPTARVAPSGVEAYKKNMSEQFALDKEIDTLERQKELYDDFTEFSNVVHKDDYEGGLGAWFKNFDSQWRANYRSNELSREADKAMSEYLKNPTEENKQIAYAYDALAKEYAQNNEEALDDKNAKASWLSKSLAGYLPQLKDQIVPELVGGGLGYLLAGNVGLGIGAGVGTYSQSYDVMRGSVYRALLAEGIDEETAKQAAEDEALISSLIESGGTALGWALAGGGKAIGAITNAAKSSVAKGSTNAATKFIANLATNQAAKKAASAAATPLWKTALKTAGGVVGNALVEYGEEFTQQAVSIANKERALQGETGKRNLVTGAGKVIGDAITGQNPEAFAEMHEAGTEGFKIGLMMGGSKTIANNVISHYANAKTVKNQNEILDAIINDEESLNALIEEGKASGTGTVSARIAKKVEQAKAEGKVTREHIKKLIASNEVYIQEEAKYNAQPLELAAMEVVEERNKKSTPTSIKSIEKATGFGNEGAKLVSTLMDSKGVTLRQAEGAIKTAYLAGMTNVEKTKARFATPLQEQAFNAGKIDRINQDIANQENAKKAKVYEGTFTENEYTKNFTEAEKKMISTVSKHFGMDSSVVDKIIADKVTGAEANASHIDGVMQISSTAEQVIHELVLHESGHRMKQLAPTEFGVLMDALYERSMRNNQRAGRPLATSHDYIKAQHDNAGITLNTDGYLEEFAVRELETIFESAEAFNNWAAEIESNPQVKSAWKKFVDWVSQIIEDIKKAIAQAKMSKEERAEAKRELAELERIKELYTDAYKSAKKVVDERRQSGKVEQNSDTKTEHNKSGEMTDRTKNILDNETRKVVGTVGGRAYISDGRIAISIAEADVEYVKSEWGLQNSDKIVMVVEKNAYNNDYVPISQNPVEGNISEIGDVYMFTTDDGRQIAIQKNYAEYFDGYNLSATFEKGAPYAIKATDDNGKFVGLVMAIRPLGNHDYELVDTKAVSMKSFKNKPVASENIITNNETTSNKESEPQAKTEGVKVGEVFVAKKAGIEYKILSRDDRNTIVEISSSEGTNRTIISNEIADRNLINMSDEGITNWVDEDSHIDNRTWEDVGSRQVKAFQYLFPEMKEYYMPLAQELLWDLDNTIKGEKILIGSYDLGNQEWAGVERFTSDAIARIKDNTNASYDDIRDALNRIINDKGQENIALAKRIELVLDEMLTDGYKTFEGEKIPPNEEYIAKKEALVGKTYEGKNADEDLDWLFDTNFSLKNKNLTINSLIPFTVLKKYINVGKKNKTALNNLEAEVRKLKRETYQNDATGYRARITGDTIGKAIKPTTNKAFSPFTIEHIRNLNAIRMLPELFKKAVYVDSLPPQKGKNQNHSYKEFHHFVAPLFMNHREFRALITAREKVNSNTLYVLKVDVLPTQKKAHSLGNTAKNAVGSQSLSVPSDISIPELVNGVKIFNYDTNTDKVYSDKDIKFSLKDTEYLSLAKDTVKNEARLREMVDEAAKANGYSIRAYHGTSRSDRVGNVFLPERATSGPMAFFTDNKEIAEGYSKAKKDTSMAYDPDYDSYETQFRIKTKTGDIPLYRAWGYLPFDARNRITKKAQQLREDWDGDNEFILDPDNKEANGGFQWQLKEARGNTLLALNEQWLNSGTLFNEEGRFLEVLEMSGVMEEFKKIGLDSIYFKDPNARYEKVYDTYLRIQNPFDTSTANNSFVDELISWYENQDTSKYAKENMESDLWDKNGIDAYDFAERVKDDIERGTFHAWTSIPDSVTDYLKHLGYDGIKDLGGKNSDVGHTVWIPFYSEQVKSADLVTYDDDGNVIPLSERFNEQNNDIRYSLKGGLSNKEFLEIVDKYVDGGKISTEKYNELIKTYGAIGKGEKPHRDVKVPAQTADDKKVSQTVRTILEAEATPDESVPTIEKMVEDGMFSYDVYTDQEAIENGEDYIKEHGWEQSLIDWFDAVNKGEVSKDTTTTGWILYNHAANSGDAKTALMILDAMVRHQRSAAQALQATRILKKLSPETQLYGVQKSVSAFQNELKEKYGKKAPDLKIDEELAKQFLNAETQEERDAVTKKIYKDIGRQMPSRFIDKWNAWRYLAMLGNPRTHVRNVFGNAFFAPVVATKNLTATVIESMVAPVVNLSGRKMLRGKSIVWGSKTDRALLKAAWSDYTNVADAVSNGGKYSDFAMKNQYMEEGRKIFKSKLFAPVEWARKGNSKLLEVEDVWFSKPHYAYALAQYCKANNITAEQIQKGKAIAPAREYAIKEAQKATYKDTNAFSQMVSEWGRNNSEKNVVKKAFNTVIEGVLPFRKTPANILVRGVEYSPLGLLKSLSYDLVQVGKGKMNAHEMIDNISAGLTGTGLLALGVYLAAEGLIRGHGEDEEEERKFKEMQGHQGYSLELPNGESITLDWLAPEALPFFVGVNLWESTIGSDEKTNLSAILNSVKNITEPMLEMSCLQGLNDLVEGVGNASSEDTSGLMAVLSSAVTSYLTQGLPTLFGQAERTSEEERMTTYTEKDAFLTGDMQYTLGKSSAKIPGWDYNQIPYIDAWGRKEASGTALKRGLNNFLNPAYTSEIGSSEMEDELLRLYEATGEASVFPDRADKKFTVDGEDKHLTADEYVRYATLKGEKSYKLITELVESDAYKSLDDAGKVKAIQDAYDYANQKAKETISNFKPQKWVAKADEFTDTENYIVFRTVVSETQDANDGKLKKEDVVDIVVDMAEDDDEAWKMYLSKYDSETDLKAEEFDIDPVVYMTARIEMNNISADYIYNGKRVDGNTLTDAQRKKAKQVRNSRKNKIVRYLNDVCDNEKDYLFLLGTEYSSIQDDRSYIRYFGKEE